MAFSSRYSVWAGAAAMVMAAPALAQDAKSVFEPRYAELHAASDARDLAAMGKILTPDFEMTDIRGETYTMATMSDMMAKMPKDESIKPKYEILSAKIEGSSAKVENQMTIKMSRAMEDGTMAELEITIITHDNWILLGGVWMLQKSVQKDISVSKDGEVVFHQAV